MKYNVAFSLVKRVFHLSDPMFINSNIFKIKSILKINNYPLKLVNKIISKLKSPKNIRYQPVLQNNTHLQNSNQSQIIFGSLPYIPKLTNKISKIMNKNDYNMKIAKKPINCNKLLFSNLKDKVEIKNRKDVIYDIKCECGLHYIGQTSQPLYKRLQQHKSNCNLKSENTAISKHHKITNHKIDFDSVRVIDSEPNKRKREFLESEYIFLNEKQTVNLKMDTQNLNTNYKFLIDIYSNI